LLASFDLETTGTDPFEARIVTAAVLLVGARFGVVAHRWLVNPGVEIPAEAAAIHGVTTERARSEGQAAAEAVEEIAALLEELWASGLPLVVMNANYDITVLACELERHGRPSLDDRGGVGPLVDPLVIDRALDRFRPGKKTLGDLCRVYDAGLDEAHASHGDALAAARVAWRMARRYSEVGDVVLSQLQDLQAEWHRAWAVDFERYLRRKGRADSIEREWPMRPIAVATRQEASS
jgi:DNA polymerase-3 subunit epsilon